jgi:uncharacterized protein YbjT (DUF2867 family)
MTRPVRILLVGATGSIGQRVVTEALRAGYDARALVRDLARASGLAARAERAVGDLTRPETLRAAVAGIDAVVFAHGCTGGACRSRPRMPGGGLR